MATALITGGSQGFGRALAAALVERGWTVIADARDRRRLDELAASVSDNGRLVAVDGDVTDATHRARLVHAASEHAGLDLLVHNASTLGSSPLPPLAAYPIDDFARVLRTNVVAPLALTQATLPLLRRSRDPAIVALSSDAAVEAYEGWGAYGASKAALDQLHHVLGAELTWARVYAFDPGDMRTAMHQRAFPGEDISDRPEPEEVVPALLRLLDEGSPSGRYRAADLAVRAGA